jgi:hypothetical protein
MTIIWAAPAEIAASIPGSESSATTHSEGFIPIVLKA